MGDIVEGGVGILNKTSPLRTAIQKVQTELRQECDVRDKRKKELEFLEHGGNPLDFKLGNATSVSVQSTSCTDQHPDLFETSEAKVSFACTASPHGDSAESSGRPRPSHCEPNSADNLMLFAVEHGKFDQLRTDVTHKTVEHGGSVAFGLPRKAYKRRNRSRSNRDGTRSSSTDVIPACGSQNSSLSIRHGPRDVKEFVADSKDQHPTLNCDSNSTNPIGASHHKISLADGLRDVELDNVKAIESSGDLGEKVSIDPASCIMAFENPLNDQHNQQSLSVSTKIPTNTDAKQPEAIQPSKIMIPAVIKCLPSVTIVNQSSSCQLNSFSNIERDSCDAHNDDPNTVTGMGCDVSFTQNSLSGDGKIDLEICTRIRMSDLSGDMKNQTLDGTPFVESDEVVLEKKKKGFESSTLFSEKTAFACRSQQNNDFVLQCRDELSGSTLRNENQLNMNEVEASYPLRPESRSVPAVSKLGSEKDEDSILKEAKIIEAKRKRIMELSVETLPTETRAKSKWDYVLEEMAWLANDFAQERIWKIAAASEICYRATFSSRLGKQAKVFGLEAKEVARTLSKAVIAFWHSVKESGKELDDQQSQNTRALSILAYAMRFLKYNDSNVLHSQAEVPLTPDKTSDLGILDMSWEDNLTEENLFYTIPSGAMEIYRNAIESHVAQSERHGTSVQEEVETSAFDSAADFEFQENVYDDNEEEMGTYDVPVAFDSNKSSRFGQIKRKQLTHAYGARCFDARSSIVTVQYADNKVVMRPSALMVKRPYSSLNASIPTKRVRTASRRVMSPFSAGTSGCMLGPNKTDASSGDTSSFQDDQSTLHGGSILPNSLESELGGEFGKQLPFESAEVSTKFKKRPKHPLQKVHWKQGLDSFHIESNCSEGLLVQPMMKKLKLRQPHDSSFDNALQIGGSATSPVASQMSNMSNSNKIVKVIGARDRGRKPKVIKMPAGQPSTGSSWSLFEDQALVVLVHDLGPNWELISDAFNGTLHFKSVFRKPQECNERHHVLMDGTAGDGADSAEDSGSSQPYRSTLPGIPKGSARQLFQRLQEPMEEDTLHSHFDKIIMIGQKQHYRKSQDPKQIQQPHSSHAISLSHVSPNNLTARTQLRPGGPVLTPLDFYESTVAGPDMLPLGNQGQLSSVLTSTNQGTASPMLSASGASSTLQGSPTMMLGNSLLPSPGSLNSSVRDGRYGVSRSLSMSVDEQQRMQQYSQMISGRNGSPHNMFTPGTLPVADRVRVRPGGNGMGIVSAINKNMPTVRPGFQGIASSSMLNSGSILSPVMASSTMPSAVGSGQGNSLLRPHETLHMTRPGMSQGSQRQMMVPDIQMQVSPGSQGMPHFSGLSSPFPNQTTSSQVPIYPVYNQQSHPASPQQPQVTSPHHSHLQAPYRPNSQQQAYALRLAKERQAQQRLLQPQPQQQQLVTSNSLVPHVQSNSQFTISSPMHNSPLVQSEANSSPVSLSPLTSTSSMNSMPQQHQKNAAHTQGVGNAQPGGNGLTDQMSKQRQRQQQQQQQLSLANRQHPQQRQQRQQQQQQQAKVLSGIGRGNPMMHQIIPTDQSQLNGFSTNPGNECSERGEPTTPLVQSQVLYDGSTQNPVQPPRQYISSQSSNQALLQKKVYSGKASSSPKHPPQMASNSDTNSQGHVSTAAPAGFSLVQQSVPALAMAGSNHQQPPPHRKMVNQIQSALQRVSQPNHSTNSEPSLKPQDKEFDACQLQTSGSSEVDRLMKMDSNIVKPETNLSSLVSGMTNSSEPVPQAGQGLGQRPSSCLPPSRHDASVNWQQQPSHVQQYQSPVTQTQQPPPQQQQLVLPLHTQQQTQLLQTVNNNLYANPGDTRI